MIRIPPGLNCQDEPWTVKECFMPRKNAAHSSLFAAALLLGLFWVPSALAQPGIFGPPPTGDVNNVFPLAPRELRQRLARAQAAVDEERYSDAVAEIGEVLNSAGSDDFFLGVPGGTDAQLSLKTQAMALLGAMPAKGRKLFDLQYGADAKAARPYFEYPRVLAGMLELYGELFGITFQKVAVPAWHEKVEAYDVLSRGDSQPAHPRFVVHIRVLDLG